MGTRSRKLLPKTIAEITNGGIYRQQIRCGKPNCKCARGEPHVAHYFFTRRDGKLRKLYVRKAELKDFEKLVNQARQERTQDRSARRISSEMLKKQRAFLFENEKVIDSIKQRLKDPGYEAD